MITIICFGDNNLGYGTQQECMYACDNIQK